MTQNRSSAVMQQRKEPPDSLDYFPTPPWATRALCEALERRGVPLAMHSVWEPACGEGWMMRPLREYFALAVASDIHQYGANVVHDFLCEGLLASPPPFGDVDWVVTNPPFTKAAEFAHRALSVASVGVALLVRTAFLEGIERYETLFGVRRPSVILQHCERVAMVKGRVDPEAGSATAYCWVVWRRGDEAETVFDWIPQCKRRLERGGDYEAVA